MRYGAAANKVGVGKATRTVHSNPVKLFQIKGEKKLTTEGPSCHKPAPQKKSAPSIVTNPTGEITAAEMNKQARSNKLQSVTLATAKEHRTAKPPPRTPKSPSEVIKFDCSNHGYRVDRTIGEGAYAKVKLAEVLPAKLARNPHMAELANGEGRLKVAIKVIDGRSVPKEFLKKFLPRELSNHVPLPYSKHVVRVIEQFRANERVYVVMEYCCRGDLLEVINLSLGDKKGLGEERVRIMFRQMALGMNHIHNNGIVHRDLKCENILLDEDKNIKITDFGFSTKFTPGKSELLNTSCGSYAYTAPEVIKVKPYDGVKSDVWSMGVILFAMLNGRLPFNDSDISELEEDMKLQRLRFDRSLSFEAKCLVRRILQFDPLTRPTTAEILADTWFTNKPTSIPRQSARRKLPVTQNPSTKTKEVKEVKAEYARGQVGDVSGAMRTKSANLHTKTTATVIVNHKQNEVVVLKSKMDQKKNLWIRGPPTSQRPNTWPRSKAVDQEMPNTYAAHARVADANRVASANCRGFKGTTASTSKQPENKPRPGHADMNDTIDAYAANNVQLSNWFVEKYMAGKEASLATPGAIENVGGCAQMMKAAGIVEPTHPVSETGDLDYVQYVADSNKEAVKIPNQPVEDRPGTPGQRTETEACATGGLSLSPRGRSAPDKRVDPCTQRAQALAARAKTAVKRHLARSGNSKKESLVSYMTSQSTNTAERVKYFKSRLMLYNQLKTKQKLSNGLPPLMVQSIKMDRPGSGMSDRMSATPTPPTGPNTHPPSYVVPQTDRSITPTGVGKANTPSATSAPPHRRGFATTWRGPRGSAPATRRAPVKPVQRVVVH